MQTDLQSKWAILSAIRILCCCALPGIGPCTLG